LTVGSAPVSGVAFDFSGLYLAYSGGKKVGVRVVKEWVDVCEFADAHAKPITGVAWGTDACFLASCSMDKTIKIHAI